MCDQARLDAQAAAHVQRLEATVGQERANLRCDEFLFDSQNVELTN